MPWKNGRGTTLEIAAEPKGAKLDDPSLLWRLSSAPVTEPGPFSAFPGLASFRTFFDGFLQFKGKPSLANQAVRPVEKRHHVGGNLSPLHDGQSDQPSQSRLFVGEGSVCPPHSPEQ